jgi:hypothetical protein
MLSVVDSSLGCYCLILLIHGELLTFIVEYTLLTKGALTLIS